jgi:hypothetical protein
MPEQVGLVVSATTIATSPEQLPRSSFRGAHRCNLWQQVPLLARPVAQQRVHRQQGGESINVDLTVRALRDDGFDGLVSLEPHLCEYTAFGAPSGPELFTKARQAFTTS